MAGYAVAVVAFVPGSLLTLAGGALFGLVEGVIYVFAAAVLGSTASFLLARYVAREPSRAASRGTRASRAIDRAVGEEGRKIVFLLRLSPVFPFNLLNYALGPHARALRRLSRRVARHAAGDDPLRLLGQARRATSRRSRAVPGRSGDRATGRCSRSASPRRRS